MELIMENIIIILSICLLILIYVSYNLFRKVEKLEKVVDSQEAYINGLSNSIKQADVKLQEIDEKGTFKSDDEIGWFFDSVKELQNNLNNFNNINR